MDKEKTDQWLRSTLQDYKPVPGRKGREAFLEAAAAANSTSGSGFWRKTSLLWLLLFLAIPILVFYFQQPETLDLPSKVKNDTIQVAQPTIPKSIQIEESQTPQTAKLESFKRNAAFTDTAKPEVRAVIQQPEIHNHETATSNIDSKHEALGKPELHKPSQINLTEDKNKTFDDEPNSPILLDEGIDPVMNSISDEAQLTAIELSVLIGEGQEKNTGVKMNSNAANTTQANRQDEASIKTSSREYDHKLEQLFYYRPELVYNLIESNKLTHNIGYNLAYHFFNGRYSITSGIGLSFSNGYYEYATEYNEFLGKFDRLDSITFAWDRQQYNLIPTIFTTEEDAFDEQVSVAYAKIYKQHLYLQIPFMMGYDFYRNSRWRVGIRTGPRMSVLIDTKTLTFLPDNGANKVIQINQITPDRIKTNWQLSAGIQLSYATKNRLIIGLEPEFSYYFNSVYESPNQQKAPWSLSLRLIFGFY